MARGPATGGTALQDAEEAMRLAGQDPRAAVVVAGLAVRRASRERDAEAAAVAERAWGHALLFDGDIDGAIRHLRRSVAHGLQAESAALTGEARIKLAYAMIQRGRPRAALEEIDAALLSLDGVAGARAQAQRAIILRLISRPKEALAEFDVALDVLRRAADLVGMQRLLLNRALVHVDLHSFDAATADLRDAERLAQRLGEKVNLSLIANNLGVVETLRGDVPAALAHLQRVEEINATHGVQVGEVHHARADLLLSVGLASEARITAERAVLAFQKQHRRLLVPEARLLLAQAAFLDDDLQATIEHAGRAMREFGRQGRADRAAEARVNVLRAQLASGSGPRVPAGVIERVADVLTDTRRLVAALEANLIAARLAVLHGWPGRGHHYLRQAARQARGRAPAALRARGWYAEALLRLNGGNTAGAAAAVRRGLRILDEHTAAMGATDLRAHAALHRRELTALGLRMALADGRPARVFEWAERGKASHLLHPPARPPDDPRLAALLSELRSVALQISQSDGGTAKLLRRQAELERQIRDHSRLQRGQRNGRLPGPVAPSRLSTALGEAALVEFMQLDGVLHALSLVDGRLRLRQLGPVDAVTSLVQRLPFALHRMAHRDGLSASRSAAMALLRSAAEHLDAALLRPLEELGDRPLVVVPTGVLHSVPWSILPSCSGRPVTVSPSATLWHATSTRHDPCAGDAVVGDPVIGDTVAVAAGPGLRGAREEASAVAAIHRATALVDDAATVHAVLTALAAADVVHLAAHGRLSADNPLFSDLQLADGPLVVYDVERLARVPHTVVLAACESGRSMVCAGDELLGLSATFIRRGAAQLVASVLPIPDAETAPLMIAFHRRLAGGVAPAAALAAAQQDLAGDDPATLAAAAGFVCLGFGLGLRHGSGIGPTQPVSDRVTLRLPDPCLPGRSQTFPVARSSPAGPPPR
jgi:tetratricopeptide (TPR) repeat protein